MIYPKKYTNITKEKIEEYLGEIDELIKCNKYKISINREKNIEFINEYNIKMKIQKDILLSIQANDFCYAEDNNKMNGEILYVFCKEYNLDHWGTIENKRIYIKINKIATNNIGNYVIVVSFHEAEREVEYLFR